MSKGNRLMYAGGRKLVKNKAVLTNYKLIDSNKSANKWKNYSKISNNNAQIRQKK